MALPLLLRRSGLAGGDFLFLVTRLDNVPNSVGFIGLDDQCCNCFPSPFMSKLF